MPISYAFSCFIFITVNTFSNNLLLSWSKVNIFTTPAPESNTLMKPGCKCFSLIIWRQQDPTVHQHIEFDRLQKAIGAVCWHLCHGSELNLSKIDVVLQRKLPTYINTAHRRQHGWRRSVIHSYHWSLWLTGFQTCCWLLPTLWALMDTDGKWLRCSSDPSDTSRPFLILLCCLWASLIRPCFQTHHEVLHKSRCEPDEQVAVVVIHHTRKQSQMWHKHHRLRRLEPTGQTAKGRCARRGSVWGWWVEKVV